MRRCRYTNTLQEQQLWSQVKANWMTDESTDDEEGFVITCLSFLRVRKPDEPHSTAASAIEQQQTC